MKHVWAVYHSSESVFFRIESGCGNTLLQLEAMCDERRLIHVEDDKQSCLEWWAHEARAHAVHKGFLLNHLRRLRDGLETAHVADLRRQASLRLHSEKYQSRLASAFPCFCFSGGNRQQQVLDLLHGYEQGHDVQGICKA